jgi:hypothetical protein
MEIELELDEKIVAAFAIYAGKPAEKLTDADCVRVSESILKCGHNDSFDNK